MPASSLLALIDDIASVLDDVAVLTKIATKKTAGVLGDDLALNAQQVTGVAPDRELSVVWAVAKGSAINKVILVPAALVVSAAYPPAVTPLLMLGGGFLCFEGAEKLLHKVIHRDGGGPAATDQPPSVAAPAMDVADLERQKIRGAIRTDFILSAEIVVIALGEVTNAPFGTRVAVLVAISTLMTVGVYGLVAGIVKLDDAGLHLARREGRPGLQQLGRGILRLAPVLMKLLSIAGTAAMFLVGGSILAHGVPAVHHAVERAAAGAGPAAALVPLAADAAVGLASGALLVAIVSAARAVWKRARAR